ncbi:MAG: F0F1 ATP synthase subunit B [Candidatus Kapabacteria bacterium]|nr:F0F1 ATP synthase subunit B [Candidatus Kapabacteria bacterium]
MPAFLQFEPGLVIWTLVNFSIFVFILAKYAYKPMRDGLEARESAIAESISSADRANAQALSILQESKEKIAGAQQEMMAIVREGKVQAEAMVHKAAAEAEVVKQQKLAESQREIDRQKDEAITALRNEVSSLVVGATEKLLGRNLQGDDQKRIIDGYVNELSKN